MSFFYGGMITVLLFSILIFVDKKNSLPKWLGLFGLLVAIIFALFIFMPESSLDDVLITSKTLVLNCSFLGMACSIFDFCLDNNSFNNLKLTEEKENKIGDGGFSLEFCTIVSKIL
ncbi:MAG: hypothetical protein KAQ77_07620 [Candidatus Heimdallarchaeota archaeon]|nr:hypothetical protein [Candidatus Heimdallarchaeota archaeon]